MKAKVDYLATNNRKHFLDNPKVAEKIGVKNRHARGRAGMASRSVVVT
ncbi:MAG: hypothetical protein Q7T89_15365 [Anaerolineales bacterium]|nr:hypothetical protein [Anaerolineales bacterium]